jgi:tetratricopeptide (TPR) repeat protein
LRQARLISPDEPRLHVNAANLWLSSGLMGDPIRALNRALCLDPEFSPAADRLLLLRKASGDGEGAMRIARRGVVRPPGARSGVLLELAQLVFDGGDRWCARALLRSASLEIIRFERDPRILLRLAKRVGGSDLLVQLVRMLLCVEPVNKGAARELASTPVENDSEWPIRAILTRLSLAMPLSPVIQNGAGVFLENQGRAEEAPIRYVKATVLDPAQSISIFNLGVQARYLGDFRGAARLFERALVVAPGDPIYRYNLGHVLLATGGAKRGLPLYEDRWRSGERQSHRRGGPTPSFPQPVWDGASLGGTRDTVLIWGEQGLGDELWFAGYVPALFPGHRTVLECDGRLTGLFTRSGLAGSVVARVDPPHPEAIGARRQMAAGSLPLLASERRSTSPTPQGYLRVDQSRALALRERLVEIADGPTIGISWRSRKPNPVQSFEAPLWNWEPVFDVPSATFVNLQYDATATELENIRARYGLNLVAFKDIDPFRDIDDLAALISVLDHVVSIANINVPLCHGIGRTCHVALRHYQEDWRFQRNQTKSEWLPDCRLYWPERKGDWAGVFSRISTELG